MEMYQEYRETAIPWLENLPSHWTEKRAKYLFNKEDRLPEESDEVITCFRDGTVTLRKNRRTTGFTESFKEIGYQGIKKGDLVIHQMDAFAGSTGVSDSNGKGTPVYSVCTPKSDTLLTQYYAKVIRHMGLNGFIQSLYRGIRERSSDFRFETFARQLLPVPPLSEQERIVKFLEGKVLKIDEYIADKEREIQLLKELKEAEIAKAVTQGLNPNVKMKDSGIPWIGMIPEHWEIARTKRILQESKEKTEKEGGTLLSLSQYTGVTLKENAKKVGMFEAESTVGYNIVHPGQFVMNIMLAWNGSYAVSDYEGIISPSYCIFNFKENCERKYFHFLLRLHSYAGAFKTMSKGIIESRLRLYPIYFLAFKTIIPPIGEQRAIVEYINNKCSKVDSLITELEAEIEHLKEYKQRLIADCVTGQIKV